MDDANDLIRLMKTAGVRFRRGLNEAELNRAETLYGIRFPLPLRELLSAALPAAWDCEYGVPLTEEQKEAMFPRWNDFTPENEARLRESLANPAEWLRRDAVQNGFWITTWGERPADPEKVAAEFDRLIAAAPKLIPLYGHRFTVSAGDPAEDPPVFSTVGHDTIRYGRNLACWVEAEFGGAAHDPALFSGGAYVPFWDDLVRENVFRPGR